eukprot:TRINITY_DN22801_c0_g1_i1.p1 TRINITY_DN22801_c0_g1~~TRINITY_DN22801_c0_g1_i1.p1  ORF type:complete len:425 (+),score=69.45 TRINITY_DN22801_c0_g1_i1:97-1371(+)
MGDEQKKADMTPSRLSLCFRGGVVVLMWVASVVVTVLLVVHWMQEGSKDRTRMESALVTSLVPPSMVVTPLWLPDLCYWIPVAGFFSQHDQFPSKVVDVLSAVTERSLSLGPHDLGSAFYINATAAAQLGARYTTQIDTMTVIFALIEKDTYMPVPGTVEAMRSQCNITTADQMRVYLLPTMRAAETAATRQASKNGSKAGALPPLHVGLDDVAGYHTTFPLHVAVLKFIETREEFKNGTAKTNHVFESHTHSVDASHDGNMYFSVEVAPNSFMVTTTKHVDGESVIQLMADVFGWVGVLCGAHIQGSIFLLAVVYLRWRDVSKEGRMVPNLMPLIAEEPNEGAPPHGAVLSELRGEIKRLNEKVLKISAELQAAQGAASADSPRAPDPARLRAFQPVSPAAERGYPPRTSLAHNHSPVGWTVI